MVVFGKFLQEQVLQAVSDKDKQHCNHVIIILDADLKHKLMTVSLPQLLDCWDYRHKHQSWWGAFFILVLTHMF